MLWTDLIVLVVAILALTASVTTISHLFLGVPYVPTSDPMIKAVLEHVRLPSKGVFYDLGAGDARVLIAVKKTFPKTVVRGSEVVFLVWLLGKLRLLLSRTQAYFTMKSLFRVSLHDADCVFLYLMPALIAKLEPKLEAELRPGAQVLSSAFSLGERSPTTEVFVQVGSRKKTLYVYDW